MKEPGNVEEHNNVQCGYCLVSKEENHSDGAGNKDKKIAGMQGWIHHSA